MIFDTLEHSNLYCTTIPNADEVFGFIKKCVRTEPEAGRYEICGSDVYALVIKYLPAEEQGRQYETHDKYLDVQYMLRGCENQWYMKRDELKETVPYSAEKDISFYDFSGQGTKFDLTPGDFAVYFPHDGHLPGMYSGNNAECVRIIVKVKC